MRAGEEFQSYQHDRSRPGAHSSCFSPEGNEERTDRQRPRFIGHIKPKSAALAMLIAINAVSGGRIHESNAATS